MGAEVLPQGGAPITRNPPVGTYPPAHGSVPPETRPPTFAPDTMHPGMHGGSDATVFAVEQRSKVGFILMLVVGGIIAVGGGGLFAWWMVKPDDAPVVSEKTPTAQPAKAGPVDEPVPDGPKLDPQPKEPEPKEPEPKEPEPKEPEPKEPEPQTPEPKQPEPKQPQPKQPKEPKQDKVLDTLSGTDMSKGLAKAAGSVKACKGPLPIKFEVTINFRQNGSARVDKVVTTNGTSLSEDTKSCVKRAIEGKAHFPKHKNPLLIDKRVF
jgi:type IV secretory pathway VirB10-like protein